MLTEKQREELHKAILEYLQVNGFGRAYEQFKGDAKLADADVSTNNVLEKKWVSVIRLQKKIDELQTLITQLKEDSGNQGKLKLLGKDGTSEHLLRMPAKHVLEGHRGQVTKVLCHPVYSLVVSSSEDSTIKLWDTETGKPERTLKGHTGAVNDLAFNKGGSLLASCSSDLSVKLWNFQTFDCLKTLQGHDHTVTGVTFLPSGDQIISASRDKTLKFWDIVTGFCTRTLIGHNEWVRKVVVHPSLPIMVSCSQDQTLIVWDITTTSSPQKEEASAGANIVQILSEHEHVVEAVAIADDSAALVIERSEYRAKLFAYANSTSASASASVSASASASASATTSSKGSEEDKDAEEGKGKERGKAPRATRMYVASGSRDKLIKIWDAKAGRSVLTLAGHDNWVRDVQFHPSGKYLLSVSDDKSIRMWDLHTGRCVKIITEAHHNFVSSIDFSEKYLYAATGSVDTTIKLWDCN